MSGSLEARISRGMKMTRPGRLTTLPKSENGEKLHGCLRLFANELVFSFLTRHMLAKPYRMCKHRRSEISVHSSRVQERKIGYLCRKINPLEKVGACRPTSNGFSYFRISQPVAGLVARASLFRKQSRPSECIYGTTSPLDGNGCFENLISGPRRVLPTFTRLLRESAGSLVLLTHVVLTPVTSRTISVSVRLCRIARVSRRG